MKTTYLKRAEMRRGLVCLVPREGADGLTCHEKTICDCRVIELLDDLDTQESEITKLRKRVEVLQKALEKYALPQTRLTKKYEEEQWRLEPGFHDPQPAAEALKESAKIAGE